MVLHSTARSFGFEPEDGTEVIATGHLSHYGPQGRTQLYVDRLEPVGAGALEIRFRALCKELRGLGYFDQDRKKPLPALPRRIAVITSATGAALQDVIATASNRLPAVGFVLIDVRVQGEGAAEQVAAAMRMADDRRFELGIDAILVTRGGGSAEDLWAFNERIVADAAYACELPLVAAIGHESDTTVIELVADVRAATPTQAVVRLVPARTQLQEQVAHLQDRLRFLLGRHLERQRQ
ncbi:MAG: exodeoxyribonuclease VII large subunit, partial [Planctomycetota bacterium]